MNLEYTELHVLGVFIKMHSYDKNFNYYNYSRCLPLNNYNTSDLTDCSNFKYNFKQQRYCEVHPI